MFNSNNSKGKAETGDVAGGGEEGSRKRGEGRRGGGGGGRGGGGGGGRGGGGGGRGGGGGGRGGGGGGLDKSMLRQRCVSRI